MKAKYPYNPVTNKPIIVEVINDKGEFVEVVVSPWIVEKPAQECETVKVCPLPDPNDEFADTDNVGRRLQQTPLQKLNQTKEGNYTESVVSRKDNCTYTKTCVQPEYFFDYSSR